MQWFCNHFGISSLVTTVFKVMIITEMFRPTRVRYSPRCLDCTIDPFLSWHAYNGAFFYKCIISLLSSHAYFRVFLTMIIYLRWSSLRIMNVLYKFIAVPKAFTLLHVIYLITSCVIQLCILEPWRFRFYVLSKMRYVDKWTGYNMSILWEAY